MGLRQTEYFRGHLWHNYFDKLSHYFKLSTRNPWFSCFYGCNNTIRRPLYEPEALEYYWEIYTPYGSLLDWKKKCSFQHLMDELMKKNILHILIMFHCCLTSTIEHYYDHIVMARKRRTKQATLGWTLEDCYTSSMMAFHFLLIMTNILHQFYL